MLVMIGAVVFGVARARAANIVWITDNSPAGFSALGGTVFAEDGWFTLLTNAGHKVIRFNPPDSQNTLLTAAEFAALNTNDLIIIGRAVASAAFQAPQVGGWNSNIFKPVMSINTYLTRASRAGWYSGSTLPNGVPTVLSAYNLTDPKTAYIFGGVAMNGTNTVNVYDEAGGQNTSQITEGPVAGGTRIAGSTPTAWQTISDWPSNTLVRANADRLGGYRMQFSAGLREASGGALSTAGGENLTATGENIFLRAVVIAINNGNLPNPPTTPMNLTGLALSGQVQLTWSASSLAAGYYIKRATVPGGPYTNIGTNGTTTSYADFAVVNDTPYYYVVSAFNSVGESPNSTEIAVTPRNAPANIVAVGGTNQITVSWDALAGADTYTVKRSTSSAGPFVTITNGLTGTSHVDAPLGNGLTYYYVVVAQLTGGGGDSGQSSTVSGTTAPGASVLTTVRFSSTALQLSWTSGGPVVSQYLIESSPDGVNFSPLTAVAGSTLKYIHGGLAPDTIYSYRVQATNAGGLSAYSNITTNRTPIGGYNINISNGGNSSQNVNPAPVPPGYLVDEGELFGDRTNGFFYGWSTLGGTNITRDARRRESSLSPDVRYDTLNQFMKNNVNTPETSATWEFELPNGFYSVHAVGGDAGAIDSVFQFNIEGINTPFLSATNVGRWAEFTVEVGVSDGRLTIKAGPQAVNHKFCFVDIYPAIAVPPVISGQPQSQTVEENRPVTLAATISAGSPTLVYQWYFNNAPLADATNRTLSFAHVPTSAQGDYYLIVTNYGGSATSTVATLTVPEDTTPPSIVSVGSLDGLTIGVCFNEELDATSAVELGNYSVNEGAVNITNIIRRLDGRSVALQIDTAITGPFFVQIFSVADYSGNLADAVAATNIVLGMSTGDIGNPLRLGSQYTCDNEIIELVGGGTDLWNAADQFYYAYKSIVGDFDAKVRVTSLASADAITKAGIVARESTNAGSAGVHVTVNPLAPGRDLAQMALRLTENAISAAVGSNIAPAGIPNAWLRLQRSGPLFTGSFGTDGTNWTIMGQTNVALGSPLLLGLGLTAHDTNLLATGIFSNFRISVPNTAVILSGATYSNGTFSASFNSSAGVNYEVIYRTNLPPRCAPDFTGICPPDTDTWTPLLTIPGDGTVKRFTDPTVPLPARRFYGIRVVP